MENPVTFGYRLYRGDTFCKLEVGLSNEQYARLAVLDEFAERCTNYTHAHITRGGVIIATVNNDGAS